MPSKKKKYNARFPAGRIKKIMQTDEEVGKVAQAVPIIISRTLELFVHSLLTKTMQITCAKNAKTLSPSHMKQCILSESRFDFLKDLVKALPDVSALPDDEVPTPPQTPAPVQVNQPNTATCPTNAAMCITQHPELEYRKHLGLPTEVNINYRNTEDNSSTKISGLNSVKQGSSQVPEFQISVPASFQISQPNFYTEVNPINLSTNPTDVNAGSRSTTNFAHTASIDEDYDT